MRLEGDRLRRPDSAGAELSDGCRCQQVYGLPSDSTARTTVVVTECDPTALPRRDFFAGFDALPRQHKRCVLGTDLGSEHVGWDPQTLPTTTLALQELSSAPNVNRSGFHAGCLV